MFSVQSVSLLQCSKHASLPSLPRPSCPPWMNSLTEWHATSFSCLPVEVEFIVLLPQCQVTEGMGGKGNMGQAKGGRCRW